MASSVSTSTEPQKRRGNDPISWYLSNIGRVPLLTPSEEIELGNQVQKRIKCFTNWRPIIKVNKKNKSEANVMKETIICSFL